MGGSCPCPRWSIWDWDPKEAQHLGGGGLPDAPSAEGTGPPPSRKFPFAHREALPGPGAGAGVHGVAVDPRGSPHKPRKGRRGERGLPGVERYAVKGWGASRGPGLGSDPPPEDPLQPPLRGLEGPERGGVVGETAPPYPPPSRASQGGSSGRRIGDFAVLEGEKARFARRGPPPQNPSCRIGSGLSWLAKYLARAKTQVG
jgi:hypothetical protein